MPLLQGTVAFRRGVYPSMQANGKLFFFPVLTMSGVESPGAQDIEHLATCGTFQHSKDLPRSKYQQHPHRETSINASLFTGSCVREATG